MKEMFFCAIMKILMDLKKKKKITPDTLSELAKEIHFFPIGEL